jgi:UDP-glucose 4-epimerase
MTKVLVTGGAGFIGSSLCRLLLSLGHEVAALDNLSTGSTANLDDIRRDKGFSFLRGDCKVIGDVRKSVRDTRVVFHLAADPQVRPELVDPMKCFMENVFATQVVLTAASEGHVNQFVFASSSTVYGEPTIIPTPEDYSPLQPISVYGASKLSSESLVMGYSKVYGFHSTVFRLANIVGPRSGHGVINDLSAKLRANPAVLDILGDGTQSKSYLHVEDCVEAMVGPMREGWEAGFYNVGSENQTKVTEIAGMICREMGIRPVYRFSGGVEGGRGWRGDVKNMLLDVSKLKATGWRPRWGSSEAVRATVAEMQGRRAET